MTEDFNINIGGHQFEKINLVTRHNRKGYYDLYKCKYCGLEGKSYYVGSIRFLNRYEQKAKLCPKRPKTKKIKITHCRGFGPEFEVLTPGSEHDIVMAPDGAHYNNGVWVMGKTEPVLVLFDEFTYIE